MKLKFLKILIVGAFLAFAACAFFISGGDKIKAQSGKEAVRKKAGILEKTANYKTWKQINKVDEETKTDVFSIADSSALG
jgi:hypothetical protein